MPRQPPDLKNAQIAKLPPRASAYRVARNLYLDHPTAAAASWLFRYNAGGKPTVLSLGPLEHVGPAAAKAKADELRAGLFHGRDPAAERRTNAARRSHAVTFAKACGHYVAAHRAGWRNRSSERAWTNTMRDYTADLAGKPVELITADDVLAVLQPHWSTRTTTMKQLRERIAAVLDYSAVRHWRPAGSNPAAWRHNLDRLLPSPRKVRPTEHRPAMDWRALPQLYAKLRDEKSVAAAAIRLALLTATRRAEAASAAWTEFDLVARLWTIPGGRTKNGKAHSIPLASEALALLQDVAAGRRDDYVFPAFTIGRPVAGSTLQRLMAVLAPGVTLHGSARSGFRDWAAANAIPAEWSEAALAHTENATVGAYKRDALIEARRDVMEHWARHLVGA
jgi:integrase